MAPSKCPKSSEFNRYLSFSQLDLENTDEAFRILIVRYLVVDNRQ